MKKDTFDSLMLNAEAIYILIDYIGNNPIRTLTHVEYQLGYEFLEDLEVDERLELENGFILRII